MRAQVRGRLLEIGDRVRLKRDAPLTRHHPALTGAVGVVDSVVHGPAWSRLGSSPSERATDLAVHVRFVAPWTIVLLNVEAEQIEFDEQPIL